MGVSQFTVASGGVKVDNVIFVNGTMDLDGVADSLILDSDGDSHISAPTNNQIDIAIGGADDFTITSNSFNVLTGSCIAGPSSTFGGFMPIAAQQNLSGAGAINITTYFTAFTSTGANALTLVDGAIRGHLKKIMHVVDGGAGTLTPSHLSGGTTITFTTVGETAELMFDGSNWIVIALYNTVTPGVPPILA